jgi:hypothetical protein
MLVLERNNGVGASMGLLGLHFLLNSIIRGLHENAINQSSPYHKVRGFFFFFFNIKSLPEEIMEKLLYMV